MVHLDGVLVQDVLLSNTRVVASIQNVIRRRLSNATISNTSQVIRNDSLKNGELLLFQAELVLFLVACPMAIGVVKCRRSPFLEHPSLMKTLSPTQVKKFTFSWTIGSELFKLSLKIFISALQCRLECEPGYIAQRKPIITCVNGVYVQGCHFFPI